MLLGLEVERLQALKMNMIEYMESLEKQIEVLQGELQKTREIAAAAPIVKEEQRGSPGDALEMSAKMQNMLEDLEDREIAMFLLGVENERLHMIMGELEDVRIAKVHNELQLKEQVQRLQEALHDSEKIRGYPSPQYHQQAPAAGTQAAFPGNSAGNRYNFISS
jgi:VIT1/CCC1 family predicted Fe2+/Mn2+ transporter